MILLKFAGMLAVLIVCTSFGFLKAFTLKDRYDELCIIISGLARLKEKIRLHGGDKKRLLSECFAVSPQKLQHINIEDKSLFNEFMENFGKTDTKGEIDRCGAYITLFEAKAKEAKTDFDEQQRLYKSLGFLGGVFICIFFL